MQAEEKNENKNQEAPIDTIVRENFELTKQILKDTQKIRRYILISQILGIIKIVLIIAPIIVAIIYLPPILKEVSGFYSNIFDSEGGSAVFQGADILKNYFETK